jgi:hypothetical protein
MSLRPGRGLWFEAAVIGGRSSGDEIDALVLVAQ